VPCVKKTSPNLKDRYADETDWADKHGWKSKGE